MMSEKGFTCVLGKDYHIINNNVDDMTYFLQDGNDVVLVINLLNRLVEENEQLSKQMNRLYNYFQDWFENIMAGEHFSEMWDIVKEDESWDDE